jgi:hypothetical protein
VVVSNSVEQKLKLPSDVPMPPVTMFVFLTTIALAISFVDALPSLYSESEICRNGGDLCTKDDMKYELILPAQPGFQYVESKILMFTLR